MCNKWQHACIHVDNIVRTSSLSRLLFVKPSKKTTTHMMHLMIIILVPYCSEHWNHSNTFKYTKAYQQSSRDSSDEGWCSKHSIMKCMRRRWHHMGFKIASNGVYEIFIRDDTGLGLSGNITFFQTYAPLHGAGAGAGASEKWMLFFRKLLCYIYWLESLTTWHDITGFWSFSLRCRAV